MAYHNKCGEALTQLLIRITLFLHSCPLRLSLVPRLAAVDWTTEHHLAEVKYPGLTGCRDRRKEEETTVARQGSWIKEMFILG